MGIIKVIDKIKWNPVQSVIMYLINKMNDSRGLIC